MQKSTLNATSPARQDLNQLRLQQHDTGRWSCTHFWIGLLVWIIGYGFCDNFQCSPCGFERNLVYVTWRCLENNLFFGIWYIFAEKRKAHQILAICCMFDIVHIAVLCWWFAVLFSFSANYVVNSVDWVFVTSTYRALTFSVLVMLTGSVILVIHSLSCVAMWCFTDLLNVNSQVCFVMMSTVMHSCWL